MQKNTNRVVETIVISNPEASLEGNLTYQSAEVQDIINNFTIAAQFRDMHRIVIDLLQATANFRYATVPNGLFYTLRNKNKSDKELSDLFVRLDAAIITAENKVKANSLTPPDKKIVLTAISYAAQSIVDRIKSLQSADRLCALWEQSQLKKRVEQINKKV
jgi:hypothetical protein